MTDIHPVHRELKIGNTGKDVWALQVQTDLRLTARNQHDFLVGKHDGELGPSSARGISRALYLLGAAHAFESAQVAHGGHVSKGAQTLVRHPGTRSPAQLHLSRQRFAEVRQAEKIAAAHEIKLQKGIHVCTAAAKLALAHAPEIHYTQGPLRWQGIDKRLIAAHGDFPHYADCSAFYSWCLWQMLRNGQDVVNGSNWTGGYTGTLLLHGERVSRPVEGAAVIYGVPGTTGEHVAYSLGDGTVISHGSEAGPFHLPYNYRSDVMEFRVYHR